jgi:glyoxylase-like metal-dependent hydrolase (beta-lactamase superfamily II)
MEEILSDLYNIKIPLPQNPLEFINCYVIKGKERSLVIDTGLNRQVCKDALSDGLSKLGVDMDKLDIFITHFHEDHIGLVPYLATDTVTIHFSKIEADIVAEYLSMGSDNPWWTQHKEFIQMRGFPEEELQSVVDSHPDEGYDIKGPLNIHTLTDNDSIDIGNYSFKCIETPGHSPGHVCLYESGSKILVSGDHILGDITPIIALWSDEVNPLKLYLSSLEKIEDLDVELVLPGHGSPFRNLRGRIEQLKEHHRIRAGEILEILKNGIQNAYQIASQMSWDVPEPWDQFPSSQKWFAGGEALAHVKYLEEEGQVQRHIQDGIIVFSLK